MTTDARPPPGTRLADLAALPDGAAIVVDHAVGLTRFSMLLVRQGDTVRGWLNVCPHARWPLDTPDGRVLLHQGLLVCAAHGALFDPMTGQCRGGPGRGEALVPVGVEVRDQMVWMGP
jgi:nitrite reductase/ring-hydroxylating ferredoxin subunit